MSAHKFPYEWTLKDATFTKDKGTVFSCFACGGGSTMGYKLAGFNVIGCNEIDPKMAECYKANHNPKYCFVEPIQTFKDRDDLPEELYELDILDGSPPCSSFSTIGNREKDWGKEKKFREGQADQVLDTLFFDFIELGKKLQPKVIIAENVKGLLLGEAQKYVNDILIAYDAAGYYVDYKLLEALEMGVPQGRQRVFFYAIRKDLYKGNFADLFQTQPCLDMSFKEQPIVFSSIASDENGKELTGKARVLWEQRQDGDTLLSDVCYRVEGKKNYFSSMLQQGSKPLYTIVASSSSPIIHYSKPYILSKSELLSGGTFPIDYRFCGQEPKYLIGMSVPPVMTAQIATRIYEQWLTE